MSIEAKLRSFMALGCLSRLRGSKQVYVHGLCLSECHMLPCRNFMLMVLVPLYMYIYIHTRVCVSIRHTERVCVCVILKLKSSSGQVKASLCRF